MYCVIMAGGRGTRFWPRSRSAMPKQLLDIVGEQTMMQETVNRVLPCCPPDHILVITNIEQEAEVRAQLPMIPADHIIAEPVGRNTAACICLAAVWISARGEDEVMAVMPADHYIRDATIFRRCLQQAVEAAGEHDVLITIGIEPRCPETGYGYIQYGGDRLGSFSDIMHVERFHEKPSREMAEGFIRQGNFYWNSGMFVWKPSVILRETEKLLPKVYDAIAPLGAAREHDKFQAGIRDAYAKVPSISIDYGVMEKSREVYVVKGDFGWNDIGSWSAIYDIGEPDGDGNVVRGEAVLHDTTGSLIVAQKRLVAASGVKDIIVVATDDAVLVCPRDRSQDVKKIVEDLERTGKTVYL